MNLEEEGGGRKSIFGSTSAFYSINIRCRVGVKLPFFGSARFGTWEPRSKS